MAEQIQPDSRDDIISDLMKRVQILEATSRIGLNRIRFAWTTQAFDVARVSTLDAWESGPATAAWQDDQGNTGTGYPTLTLVTGRRALFLAMSRWYNVANEAGFIARTFAWGVGQDGAAPVVAPATYPTMALGGSHGPSTEGTPKLAMVSGRADLTPGTHTFKMWGYWATGVGGGALLQPSQYEGFMCVLPID